MEELVSPKIGHNHTQLTTVKSVMKQSRSTRPDSQTTWDAGPMSSQRLGPKKVLVSHQILRHFENQ